MRLSFLPLTCLACMTSIALIKPAYLLRLSTNTIETSSFSRVFWRCGPGVSMGSITRFRQRSVLAMTRIAFRTASSYTAGFRTAEQPGPKNPATSESLMGSHGVEFTKVHLHGRGSSASGGFQPCKYVRLQATNPPCFQPCPNESTVHCRSVI
jgi:hypothetical protein